jgi:hypothetical protein
MEGFDTDPFMTPKSDCKLLFNKRPTKALKKKRFKFFYGFFGF